MQNIEFWQILQDQELCAAGIDAVTNFCGNYLSLN